MRVDFPGHHRLARQVDVAGAGRLLYRAFPADLREATVLDDERRVFDRRATVTRNEPCALVHDGCNRAAGA
jgi:hypothetical protein